MRYYCKAGNQNVQNLLLDSGFEKVDNHLEEIDDLPVTHNLVNYGIAIKSTIIPRNTLKMRVGG